jgi:hypothetical protein
MVNILIEAYLATYLSILQFSPNVEFAQFSIFSVNMARSTGHDNPRQAEGLNPLTGNNM